MNDRDVRAVLTIAKYLSITKAAGELYVTQPTLSRTLAKVEEELGVCLFDRDGNKLVPTKAGRALHERFAEIDEAFERLHRTASGLAGSGRISVVVGYDVPFYVYAQVFMDGRVSGFEDVALSNLSADHGTLREMLLSERLDFAISYVPVTGERIACQEIMREEIVVMASKDHPLAKKDGITSEDMDGRMVIALPRNEPFRLAVDPALAACKIQVEQREVSDYAEYAQIQKECPPAFLSFASEYGTDIYPPQCVCLRFKGRKPYLVTHLSWLIDGIVDRDRPELAERIAVQYRTIFERQPYSLLKRMVAN